MPLKSALQHSNSKDGMGVQEPALLLKMSFLSADRHFNANIMHQDTQGRAGSCCCCALLVLTARGRDTSGHESPRSFLLGLGQHAMLLIGQRPEPYS
ncbi:hypothetical protein XELAEV_18000460mg [Xenopus laevis]|uniref:Uncharacterized protein n=1 Tax=Xenopus laevis TaxID=8355 RepID=A0A974BNY8_XENLA|nr:hypothetical protein XELAEV_18000460mg [Xenopus laevis]